MEKNEKKNSLRYQLSLVSLVQKQFFMNYIESAGVIYEAVLEYSFPINFISFDHQWHQLIWSNTFEMISQYPSGTSGKWLLLRV
jgi:hypothetical protein